MRAVQKKHNSAPVKWNNWNQAEEHTLYISVLRCKHLEPLSCMYALINPYVHNVAHTLKLLHCAGYSKRTQSSLSPVILGGILLLQV